MTFFNGQLTSLVRTFRTYGFRDFRIAPHADDGRTGFRWRARHKDQWFGGECIHYGEIRTMRETMGFLQRDAWHFIGQWIESVRYPA